MNNKLLTIITVCYNSEKTIKKTISSVLSQISDNIEYIIVDGDSTDHTLSIIKSFNTEKIKLISEKDSGIYDAMNKGIAHSTGKWIQFLNSDDWFMPNIFQYIEDALISCERYDFVYGDTLIHKKFKGKYWIGVRTCINKVQLTRLKEGMQFPHQALFVKKKVFDEIGNFDLSFPITADWDFILHGYLKGFRFHRLHKIIMNFSIGGISSSNHYIRDNYIMENHRVRKKNKVVKYFDKYMLSEIFLLFHRCFIKYISVDSFYASETAGFRLAKKYKIIKKIREI